MPDYRHIDIEQLETLLIERQTELGIEDLEPGDITSRVADGSAVVEVTEHGVAVIQLERASGGAIPFLWMLYVDPEKRGRGVGAGFVRELLSKYSEDYHMSLKCYGSRRRAFFAKAGFRVESRDGEERRMTTNDLESVLRMSR